LGEVGQPGLNRNLQVEGRQVPLQTL
jgi:hypothetical protein